MTVIGICDDEKKQRDMLRRQIVTALELEGQEAEIREYSDAENLLAQTLRDRMPDVLFLDIEMGEMNGVEAAARLREHNRDMEIVIVTGYPDYVFRGYEIRAFEYILKPYKEEKIRRVLVEALRRVDRWKDNYICIQERSGLRRLNAGEVICFVSDLRKVRAVLEKETVEFYGRLGEVEKVCPPFFIRTHQRYLVNMSLADRLETGWIYVRDRKLPVSRARQQDTAAAFARLML